ILPNASALFLHQFASAQGGRPRKISGHGGFLFEHRHAGQTGSARNGNALRTIAPRHRSDSTGNRQTEGRKENQRSCETPDGTSAARILFERKDEGHSKRAWPERRERAARRIGGIPQKN